MAAADAAARAAAVHGIRRGREQSRPRAGRRAVRPARREGGDGAAGGGAGRGAAGECQTDGSGRRRGRARTNEHKATIGNHDRKTQARKKMDRAGAGDGVPRRVRYTGKFPFHHLASKNDAGRRRKRVSLLLHHRGERFNRAR